jgi:hypothetical protein
VTDYRADHVKGRGCAIAADLRSFKTANRGATVFPSHMPAVLMEINESEIARAAARVRRPRRRLQILVRWPRVYFVLRRPASPAAQ